MKEKDILKVNRKIELMRPDDEKVYKSLIQDIFFDSFAIGAPFHQMTQHSLDKGENVKIAVFLNDVCYQFNSQVIGQEEEKGLQLYILKKPKKYKRLERREFVRVNVLIKTKFVIVGDKRNWKNTEAVEEAIIVDLSGGGLQIKVFHPLPDNSLLVLDLPLELEDKNISLKLLGRVKRMEKEVRGKPLSYKLGLMLEDISQRETNLLKEFVFIQSMRNTLRGSDLDK